MEEKALATYIIKRLGLALLTIWMVATLTFFLMNLVPGGPFLAEKAPSAAVLKAMEAKYGLDKPLVVQYKNYMLRIAQGDLGVSIKKKGREITEIIGEKFPVSAKVGGVAIVVALATGIPLGAVSALKRGKWQDNLLRFIFTLGIAVPGFVVATSLLILLGVKLPLLPTVGLTSPAHYIMPVITLSLYPMAYMARLMRSSMLDVLDRTISAPPAPKACPAGSCCSSMRCATP
jgi:oligopeptide transport system permease protein